MFLYRNVGDSLSGCWATIGVLLEKGAPRVSSSGKTFSICKIGSLDGSEVSVFLFDGSHINFSGDAIGAVFAFFNSSVRRDNMVCCCLLGKIGFCLLYKPISLCWYYMFMLQLSKISLRNSQLWNYLQPGRIIMVFHSFVKEMKAPNIYHYIQKTQNILLFGKKKLFFETDWEYCDRIMLVFILLIPYKFLFVVMFVQSHI